MTAAPLPELRGSVRVTLALKTVTEGNAEENWRTKAGRAKRQRSLVAKVLPWHVLAAGWGRSACGCLAMPPGGLVVTLTRIAPSPGLDPHDNLPTSQKHVVDEIAHLFKVDDADPRWTWKYEQRRGSRKDTTLLRGFGVEIAIYSA